MSRNVTLLNDLAVEINKANDDVTNVFGAALGEALIHGMRAGDLLIEAKRQHKHGDWGKWMSENLTFSDRLAHTYMQLARHRDEIELKVQNRSALLSVNQALKLIAAPKPDDGRSAKPKPKPKPKAQPAVVSQQVHELQATWKESGAEGRQAFREWIDEPADTLAEQPNEININDATSVPTDNILEQMFGPLTGAEWSEMADQCSYRTGRGKNRKRIISERFMKLVAFHSVPLEELEAAE